MKTYRIVVRIQCGERLAKRLRDEVASNVEDWADSERPKHRPSISEAEEENNRTDAQPTEK